MFKKSLICLCLVVCLSPMAWAANQDVLGVMDDWVYGVIRLETKAADFSGSLDALLNLASQTLEPRQAEHLKQAVAYSRRMMEGDLETFQQAGGREIYAIFNLRDIPLFSLAFPVDAGVDAEGLKAAIEKVIEHSFNIDDLAVQSHEKLILVGKRSILEAMTSTQATTNPLWASLLDQEPSRPLQLVVVPNEMQLRVLKEMWPATPGVPGMEQFKTMLMQCRWLTVSAQVVPEMACEFSVEMQSKEMADQAVALWKVMIPFIAEPMDIDTAALNAIQTDLEGGTVTWSVSPQQSRQILGPVLLNPVHKLVAFAEQMACGNNVSGMGKAILIYANDHNDLFPSTLDVLMQPEEMPEGCAMPPKGLICPAVNEEGSYGYCGDGLGMSSDPGTMIVYDKANNHVNGFRNVLFLDSHVEWISPKRFEELKQKVNAEREKRGLPPHVFE